jgi:hypothetical protein
MGEQDKKIERNRSDTERYGNPAVPDQPLADRIEHPVKAKKIPWNDERDAAEVERNPKKNSSTPYIRMGVVVGRNVAPNRAVLF